MNSLSLHADAARSANPDPTLEVLRLTSLLEARRAELVALQKELRDFKARYARTVGSRMGELAELEREIRLAEARTLGVEEEEGDVGEGQEAEAAGGAPAAHTIKASVRSLFWAVARLFHPDHATDEAEARRRHSIMAEASRAYREGDAESLHTLLGDEDLQLYCATPRSAGEEGEVDLSARLVSLKEELLTIEFGIKRAKQDRLYRLMREAEEFAAAGRDKLAEESERLARKIAKTRNRLAHLS